MNFATGPSGEVDSRSSTSLSPTGKNAVVTFWVSTVSEPSKLQSENVGPKNFSVINTVDSYSQMVNFEYFHFLSPLVLHFINAVAFDRRSIFVALLRRTERYASVVRLAGAAHQRSRCVTVFMKRSTKSESGAILLLPCLKSKFHFLDIKKRRHRNRRTCRDYHIHEFPLPS